MKLFATVLSLAVLALAAGPVAAQQCSTGCAPAAVKAQAVVVPQYHVAPAAVAVPVAVVAVPSAPLVQLQVQPQAYYAAPAVVQQVQVQHVQQVRVQAVKAQAVQAHPPQRVVQRSVIRSR